MKKLKRTALYGGTFDPVHNGHIRIAQTFLELFALDDFCFVPAHVAPHKRETNVTPPLHRYAMLALATQADERMRISTVELDAPEKPYTIDTLLKFCAEEKGGAQFFFVMGADSWAEIRTWRDWERLLQLTNHIVVTRPGYELNAEHVTAQIRERIVDLRGLNEEQIRHESLDSGGAKIYVTDAVVVDVSATSIRRDVRNGSSREWRQNVPPPVADYIQKYKLYKDRHETELDSKRTGSAH